MRDLKSTRLFDSRFAANKRRYVLQATLAAAVLGAVLAVADSLSDAAIVTAIASSTFIIFTSPHSASATSRRVLGGHVVGVLIGLTAGGVLHGVLGQPYETNTVADVWAAGGVGLVMLAMAVTDTEHPPAAGTILGLAMADEAIASGVLVLAAALALCLARAVLSRWLMDLSSDAVTGERSDGLVP